MTVFMTAVHSCAMSVTIMLLLTLGVQQFASASHGVCTRRLSRQESRTWNEIRYHTSHQVYYSACGLFGLFRCRRTRQIRVSRQVQRRNYYRTYYTQYYCCPGFTGSPPDNCKRLCNTLSNIANGRTSYRSRVEGNVATFSCNSGYRLVGASTATCRHDGSWTPLPTCNRVCPGLNQPGNGTMSVSSYFVTGSATYSCNSGYQLIGSSTRSCLSNGSWSSSPPTCHRLCPTISNTTVLEVDHCYTDGCVAMFSCKFGYGMVGPCTQACLSTGEWTGPPPNCYKLFMCPEPVAPSNGIAEWTHRAVGTTVSYACSPGYELVGAVSRTCQENAVWTETAPTCERVCPVLDEPGNGTLVVSSYFVAGSATYSCNPGYLLVGSLTRNCFFTGTWSSSPPTCHRVCPSLTNPINGTVKLTTKFVGDVASYDCDSGFGLVGSGKRICYANGSWSINIPRCDPVCDSLQSLDHGTVNVSSYFIGDIAHYSCDLGYELHGHSDRRCEGNQLWSAEKPVCIIIKCHRPSAPHSGFIDVDSYEYGAIARFSCSPGNRLSGPSVRKCMLNRRWSGFQPFCNPTNIQCTELSAPENGSIDVNSEKYGGVAMYSCDTGYRLVGSLKRTCVDDGIWSGSSPHCLSSGSGDCDCLNGGSCVDDSLGVEDQGSGVTCVCPSGFSGDSCQDEDLESNM